MSFLISSLLISLSLSLHVNIYVLLLSRAKKLTVFNLHFQYIFIAFFMPCSFLVTDIFWHHRENRTTQDTSSSPCSKFYEIDHAEILLCVTSTNCFNDQGASFFHFIYFCSCSLSLSISVPGAHTGPLYISVLNPSFSHHSLKSLALAKMTYVSLCLTVPEKITKIIDQKIFRFLCCKRDRIKRKSIANQIEKGGLNMIDVRSQFSAIKAYWVGRIVNAPNDHLWAYLQSVIYPSLEIII